MGLIYNIGIYFYGAFIFLASLFNKKARMLRKGQQQAFAQLKTQIEPNARYVWFHAASLGEFEQGRPVMEQLKRDKPETKILLTFFSPSGYEVRKNYAVADIVSYLPLDVPGNAWRFVNLVKPSKAIFVKYEFWPNYLLALQAENIPVISISAIFRPEQVFFKNYGKWYKKLLLTFQHIFVQDKFSKELLQAHGINNVAVAGDTRFDRVYDLYRQAKQLPLIEEFVKGAEKVIIAGSTWPKDEELLVQYLRLHPDVKLIIAPHEVHASHITEISKLLDGKFVRYSDANADNVKATNCLVIDIIGILSSVYRYGHVAYIGGGFGVGIHNTLEAAVYGIPVVFGTNYQKFREARELIAIGGAFSISNYVTLEAQFDLLLKDSSAGKIAGEYVKSNTGATEMILKQLKQ
ncbi:Three-deoxy-D-manno-octulosonic-acid transferase domain-containing protein [Paludibacter propionicigenes WB4]|uniref:3-deoxy-D-manno-octulosonic acid transferase n=1 Tax=Paludibacter propionicigenes (strain DSM 17365 / JCM 13257 / WB4) TaxID=694427 RepID=E4T7N4_PALPW|nr:glycosyltransferase N-terminal domain-containing protein [Paludibacter propionicigenes]ADQ80728.1 Three-deoxy-D-manno-octulosonic-acid transferase domain-containing protein [Paludibacter propionicigenes WB4]